MLLGDLFRDIGDLDAAEEHYKQAQVLQNSPVRPVLRLAIIAARKGEFSGARQYLALALVNYALAIWKDVDAEYITANEARELASELQSQIQ